ncbi:MAG: MBL fold metallo-hydrolase [Cellulomonadaceae bacterium]|nr:MBL fold metallo-hydrolase [Cellulomonadaceae bacterium]
MDVELTLLTAGSCSHPEAVARRGAPWRAVDFPALVAVIRHPRHGITLFDTGYSPRFFEATAHLPESVYARAIPVRCTPEQTALAQLAGLGISADEVRTVVLSHLHADHVGGALDFPGAGFVALREALAPLDLPRGARQVARGVLAGLLPADLADRTTLVDDLPEAAVGLHGPLGPGRDLFGDGSLVLVPLPGHAQGHLGLLVRTAAARVLLVGDAAWSTRAVTHLELPHPVVRLVTHRWPSYAATIGALRDLTRADPDLHVVPSHCPEAIARARATLAAAP